MEKDKKSNVKKTLDEIKKLEDEANLKRKVSAAKSSEEIWHLKKAESDSLLEAQKEYISESARVEHERAEEEYRYRLATAKTDEARRKIIYQHKRELLEREQEAYLDLLKSTAKEEEKILAAAQKDADERKAKVIKDLEELGNAQASYSEKLQPASLLETVQISVGGEDYKREQLKDFSDDNKALKDYKERMIRVSERLKEAFGSDKEGYSEIIDVIRSSPEGEGGKLLMYMDMAQSDELLEYVRGYRENRRLTQEIAGYSFLEEREALEGEIKAAWDKLPEEFFDLGSESARGYGAGFLENIRLIMNEAKKEIESTMKNVSPTPELLRFFGNSGKNTNFTSNINITGAVSDRVRERIRAEHTYNMQKYMVGGY